jgi:hypothetical protein
MRRVGRSVAGRARAGAFSALLIAMSLSGCADMDAVSGIQDSVETDPEVLAAMAEAIQDEYRAETIYIRVVDDFGEVRPFSNILFAEVRHSEAIARLYQARGLIAPVNQWTLDGVPGFASLAAACGAGVDAEIDNAEIYEKYFDLELPADVRQVFESNRAASLYNHLPAFERCS